jgi:carboxymethylenebutenolidase
MTRIQAVQPPADDGYLVRPAAPGEYPGVIVAHQLFGVTADIRATADRIAALGYVVAAPNFYHRSERRVELPADDTGRAHGFKLMGELTRDGVLADVAQAGADLRAAGASRIAAMVGLSMGGHLAYYTATQISLPVTIVLYPGWLTEAGTALSRPGPVLDLTGGITGRLVLITGSDDHVVTAAQRDAIAGRLAADGVTHEMIVIDGAPHAFLAEDTPTYRPVAAATAWRVIEEALADA